MANRKYNEDNRQAFHCLICLIQVWNPKDGFSKPPQKCLEIAEVSEIEISDSYKQLISKATVKFPRGTVIRKTSITTEEVVNDAKTVSATLDNHGVLWEKQGSYSAPANVTDFPVGHRIRIFVGYTTDHNIAEMPKYRPGKPTIFTDTDLHKKYLNALTHQSNFNGPLFDGYISKVSIDSPIEIECESLAGILREFSCKNYGQLKDVTVNDLFKEGGQYDVLKNLRESTGFELYPDTAECTINIGNPILDDNLTIADICTTWSKNSLYTYVYVDYDEKTLEAKPYIVVGRSYFALNFSDPEKGKDSILVQRKNQGFPEEVVIAFDYHVAENGLTLQSSDKKFLCIQGQANEGNSFYHLSLIENPDWLDGQPESDRWRWINESKTTKKQQKAGQIIISSGQKINLDLYTVVPYISRRFNCPHDQLKKEMIAYYQSYHCNGIDGTLTLFGDLQLRSGIKVRLVDEFYPAKNGYYFVDEVTTKFGTGGFRQTIKLPYCISLDSDNEKQK